MADDEMFRVQASGKRKKKAWKRVVTKITFVDPNFTRKPPKYERIYKPFRTEDEESPRDAPRAEGDVLSGHFGREEESLFCHVHVIGSDHQRYCYRGERVGARLGSTTASDDDWGKYAQVTNDPELDGINAVLLVLGFPSA